MAYEKDQLFIDKDYWGDSEGLVAQLPHSCDEWVIGGIKEIDNLIADLEKAKKKLTPSNPTKGKSDE